GRKHYEERELEVPASIQEDGSIGFPQQKKSNFLDFITTSRKLLKSHEWVVLVMCIQLRGRGCIGSRTFSESHAAANAC
ncbi:hypothetical protein L9F63_018902, partial [Diploptera punctata]